MIARRHGRDDRGRPDAHTAAPRCGPYRWSRSPTTSDPRREASSPLTTENPTTRRSLVPEGGWLPAAELAAPLPDETDVLVIGGGLAGTALAYYLARHGVEVVLVERGELNREASGTNAGSFHYQIALHQLTARRDRERARPPPDGGPAARRGRRGLGHARGRAERAARHPRDRRPDGRRDAGGAPAPLRQAGDRGGGRARDARPHRARAARVRAVPRGRSHRGELLPRGGTREPVARRAALRPSRRRARRRHSHPRGGDRRSTVDPDGGAQGSRSTTAAGRIRAHRIVNAAGAWAAGVAAMVGLDSPRSAPRDFT